MLDLLNIKKYYDKTIVLDIPALRLQQNIYWAKGPNGSGKSTLLRMVAGLLPFQGNILLDGISLKKHPLQYRSSVSWADAEPLFPLFLTATELINLFGSIRRSSLHDASALIELFGMHHFVNHKISTYSSGMIKKLSLLLAFLGNNSLIVLDEPLITLDKETVQAVCALISERCTKGTTFLLSSHMDMDSNLLMAARQLSVQHHTVQSL
jgi:ABC-2 type transport system ATP-binding protein